MISKRIFIDAANDNYARLAAYIADAGHKGKKIWYAGAPDALAVMITRIALPKFWTYKP